jgi:tRNA(Ile)-lysidine synthetase-like protein
MTPDPKTRFVDFVRETIARHDLLPRLAPTRSERKTVIVGVSGGPDSVALLRALHELAEKNLAIALVAAHLNHGLRGKAADEDQAFVENLACQLKLPCEAARADIRAEAAAAGIGIEEAGRMARRRFFAEVARKHGAAKVALAHHADDRAETVLFNILRGTGIEGLAAIRPRSPLVTGGANEEVRGGSVATATLRPDLPCGTAGLSSRGGPPVTFPTAGQASHATPLDPKPEGIEIIRPLIETPRDLALRYLGAISQDYRHDETNLADYHTRNRVRNMLLPLLAKEFNPRVDEALVRLSEQASAAGEVLADALDEVWGKIVREGPTKKVSGTFSGSMEKVPDTFFVVDADDFVACRPWMQGAILRRAVSLLGGGMKQMSAERTREVARALLSKPVVGPIDLPGDLVVERNRRAIRIGRRA